MALGVSSMVRVSSCHQNALFLLVVIVHKETIEKWTDKGNTDGQSKSQRAVIQIDHDLISLM
jgi:hypothetical protein